MLGISTKSIKSENIGIEGKLSTLTLHQQKPHYFQDTNYFTPLVKVPPQRLAPGVFFSIMFDSRQTANVNQTSESIYLRNGCQYCKLVKLGPNSFLLINSKTREVISPEGVYQYIITTDNNVTEVRVGRMPHFYFNDKRFNHVIVAGDVIFKKVNGTSAIFEFNDQSGGYHVKDLDEDIYKLKLATIKATIEAVGLPLDKFKFYSKPTIQEIENRATQTSKIRRRLSLP